MFLKKKRKEAAKELTIHSAGVITALGKVLEAKLVVFRSSWSTGWICLHKCNGEVEREREIREKRKDRKEGFSMTLKPMAEGGNFIFPKLELTLSHAAENAI